MASATTALSQDIPLKRRAPVRIIERPHSLSSFGNISIDTKDFPQHIEEHTEEILPTSPSDLTYESRSDTDSSGDDVSEGPEVSDSEAHATPRPSRPRVDTSDLPKERVAPDPATPTTRSWYEFDLAVVVALVSPIGNWLTGGDHVKNLLLIVLLIFYLHQIIEGMDLSSICVVDSF